MTIELYFDEKEHKYTDNKGNVYNSTTTVISEYGSKFDTVAESIKCYNKYYNVKGHRYYGMTPAQIRQYWKNKIKKSLDRGNERHNYLEDTVKTITNYKEYSNKYSKGRLYTIDEILKDRNIGSVSLDDLVKHNIKFKYKDIYNVLLHFSEKGYKMYAEVGLFDYKYLISGMADLVLIKDDNFVLMDWKSGKHEILFEAGYYKRDFKGRTTDIFVSTNETMSYPINHLPECNGSHYALQLSMYTSMIEDRNLKNKGIYLCHIKPEMDRFDNIVDDSEEKVIWINMTPYYYKHEVNMIKEDFYKKRVLKKQCKMNM